MKKIQRLFKRAMGGFALGLVLANSAFAQSPIVIQFSHVVTADTAKGKAALKFKELAEERTAGKVRVEVYPNSQLYKDREEMDALKLGAVQMLAPSLSKLGGDFEVFDLPFLFKDHASFQRAANSPVGTKLLDSLESKGIKGLAYWDNGFKVFTANRPLNSLAAFNGLKIRIQASKTLSNQMKLMGAEPSVSPLFNVLDALKSGRLDGQENTPVNVYSQRLHERQSHMTVSNHGYLAYAVIVNKAFWEKLPSGIRGTLSGALRDATVFENSIAEAENTLALERIKSNSKLQVHTPGPQELMQWRSLLDPVALANQSGIPVALMDSVVAASRPVP